MQAVLPLGFHPDLEAVVEVLVKLNQSWALGPGLRAEPVHGRFLPLENFV